MARVYHEEGVWLASWQMPVLEFAGFVALTTIGRGVFGGAGAPFTALLLAPTGEQLQTCGAIVSLGSRRGSGQRKRRCC